MEKEKKEKVRKKKIECLGNRDIYKFYINKCKSKEIIPKSSSICKQIWEEMNFRVIHLMLQESEEFIIPCGLGKLRVLKKDLPFNSRPNHHKRIDWGQTTKLGYNVYYTNDIVYKIAWYKKANTPGHQLRYFFKPCITLRRTLTNCIKVQKKDYFK